MLNLIATILLATPTTPTAEPSQGATPTYDWTVQVDPLTTALGFVHAQVERRFGQHWSVYVGPHMRLFSAPWAEAEDFVGAGLELGVRYYFRPTAPQGWWALIRGVGARLRVDEKTGAGGYVSGLGGYTWIVSGGLVLSAGAGVQYLNYRIEDLGPTGIFPALHTALGFAF